MLSVDCITRELRRPEFRKRFWSKVARTRGCWRWLASKDCNGYGRVGVGHEVTRAHRIAWMMQNRPVDSDVLICHRCDNPSCVRPSHLFSGTHKDNLSDAASKDRTAFGERHPMAVISEAKVRAIRALHLSGFTREEIAPLFGVSPRHVSKVARSYSWRRTV